MKNALLSLIVLFSGISAFAQGDGTGPGNNLDIMSKDLVGEYTLIKGTSLCPTVIAVTYFPEASILHINNREGRYLHTTYENEHVKSESLLSNDFAMKQDGIEVAVNTSFEKVRGNRYQLKEYYMQSTDRGRESEKINCFYRKN